MKFLKGSMKLMDDSSDSWSDFDAIGNDFFDLDEDLINDDDIDEMHFPTDASDKVPRNSNVVTDDEEEETEEKPQTTLNNKFNKSKKTADLKIVNDSCFSGTSGWARMHLSKPLLKAISDLGFITPTIIQRDAIPLALQGRDILGTAQTGSGKTAAFLLPILERLCQSAGVRQRRMTPSGPIGGGVATKALILLPTRELAVQCFDMLEALAKYTPITKVLVTGGMSQKSQEMSFRQQPDIVIATPGRVLDLLLNSQSVHLELLEIIVLDEADRLLELGFKEECLRVLNLCSKSRQTLLFSATLSDAIQSLAALSLRRPLRVDASSSHSLPSQLEQVLVPVRQIGEDFTEREAILMHLCFETYQDKRTIVFFRTKKSAHRAALLFRLLGIPHAELHGNLTQTKRLEALEKFHNTKSVRFLLCSELAARGLDISDVDIVINFCVPPDAARYVHQVGRTARIGNAGIAVTLFSTDEKRQVKKIIKLATKGAGCSQPVSRSVHADVTAKWVDRIRELEKEVKTILHSEHLERELRLAEMELAKIHNLRSFDNEIMARPKRQWIRMNDEQHVANPSEREEAAMLSNFEKSYQEIEQSNQQNDEDDEFNEEGSEDVVVTDGESDGLDSDDDEPARKKVKIGEKKKVKIGEKKEKIGEMQERDTTDQKKAKGSKKRDEKNRLQKGEQINDRRKLTPKQKAVMADTRATKAIGKKVKKSKQLARKRVVDGHSDDDDEKTKKVKRQKKKKGVGQTKVEPKTPQKLTRKIRAANKRYADKKKAENGDKMNKTKKK